MRRAFASTALDETRVGAASSRDWCISRTRVASRLEAAPTKQAHGERSVPDDEFLRARLRIQVFQTSTCPLGMGSTSSGLSSKNSSNAWVAPGQLASP